MSIINILKIIFLFLVFWQGTIVILRFLRKLLVTAFSIFWLAIGLTGFIYLQYLI